jgi:4-alpha-glucanotransferase
MISPEMLVKDGYISSQDLGGFSGFDPFRVDFAKVAEFKGRVLNAAFETFRKTGDPECRYDAFATANTHWLDDYALFGVLKARFSGAPWYEWPPEIRDRDRRALDELRQTHADEVRREKFFQFLFYSQWMALKSYCNQKQIQVMGDLPIYIGHDSSDVWTNPQFFKLDADGKPAFMAGVPPDYFSSTGQLWGNPVYDWDNLKKASYSWWVSRMEHNLKIFDMMRLDHFRGLEAYWEVPEGETTAINGKWSKVPALDFFKTLLNRFSSLPIIAEDLGIITSEVRELMSTFDFPGMKVLLFAFGNDMPSNPYIPHNHVRNCVVYTGTHDNNTARGWFEHEATEVEKKNLSTYLGCEVDADNVAWELVRTAMRSVASIVVIPIQDFLGLGKEGRMNRPSFADGNWEWRVGAGRLNAGLAEKIAELTRIYGRT